MSGQIAFALAHKNFVVPSLVRTQARDVRIDAGNMWARDGGDWRDGWKQCREDGYRLVKVRIAFEE